MRAFPFSEVVWGRVSSAGLDGINASFVGDDILHRSAFEELLAVLAELRERYGRHPTLVETEADFTSDTSRSITLYHEAIQIARAGGLPTYSIRISLASLYLHGPPRAFLCVDPAHRLPGGSWRVGRHVRQKPME
jgi:hypothetical protein